MSEEEKDQCHLVIESIHSDFRLDVLSSLSPDDTISFINEQLMDVDRPLLMVETDRMVYLIPKEWITMNSYMTISPLEDDGDEKPSKTVSRNKNVLHVNFKKD